MIKSIPLANAATVITAVFYIVCALLSSVAPDVLVGIANSWIHSLNLEPLRAAEELSMGTLVMGLVTLSALTWITTYVMIELYNHWAK